MGKASSSKKVARAAGIGGGRTYRRNTPWGYFGIIALIVVLGIAGTVASRERRTDQINNAGKTQPPTVGTVWNQGYAVYVCGTFLKPISSKNNPQGIHTSDPGNGIIHIAPTVNAAAGKNATLGKFADAVGMKLNAGQLQVPGGKLYEDGNSCEGKPGHVYVKHFAFIGDTTGQLYNGDTKKCTRTGQTNCGQLPKLDPRDVPLGDQELLTIAFVPASDAAKIPPPPAYVNTALSKLAASSTSTTTTVPGSTTATTTTGSGSTTATTTPKASSTTVAK